MRLWVRNRSEIKTTSQNSLLSIPYQENKQTNKHTNKNTNTKPTTNQTCVEQTTHKIPASNPQNTKTSSKKLMTRIKKKSLPRQPLLVFCFCCLFFGSVGVFFHLKK